MKFSVFLQISEHLPGTVAAQQLTAALKDKCTAEEALLLIKDLPNPLQEDDGMKFYVLKSTCKVTETIVSTVFLSKNSCIIGTCIFRNLFLLPPQFSV